MHNATGNNLIMMVLGTDLGPECNLIEFRAPFDLIRSKSLIFIESAMRLLYEDNPKLSKFLQMSTFRLCYSYDSVYGHFEKGYSEEKAHWWLK